MKYFDQTKSVCQIRKEVSHTVVEVYSSYYKKKVLCRDCKYYSKDIVIIHPEVYIDEEYLIVSYEEFKSGSFDIPCQDLVQPVNLLGIDKIYRDPIINAKNTRSIYDQFPTGKVFSNCDGTSHVRILEGIGIYHVLCQNLEYPNHARIYHRNNIITGDFNNYLPIKDHKIININITR